MTREEAINAITQFIENYACGNDLIGLNTAIETLKKERPHGEWKPCSVRLPEEDGKYLVTRRSYISKKPEVTTAIFDFTTKEFYPDSNAWMPLPEPYKKEGSKE